MCAKERLVDAAHTALAVRAHVLHPRYAFEHFNVHLFLEFSFDGRAHEVALADCEAAHCCTIFLPAGTSDLFIGVKQRRRVTRRGFCMSFH